MTYPPYSGQHPSGQMQQSPAGSKDPRRPRLLAVVVAAALVCAALVVTIVVTGSNRIVGQPVAASGSSPATTTPQPNATTGDPADGSGPVVTGSAGSELPPPTGAKVPQLSKFNVGDCADPRTQADHTVTMFRADCGDATFALDQVAQGDCPLEHFAGVGPEGASTYCFTWLLDVGDCVNVKRWYRVPCDSGATGDSETSKVLDVKVGESDGQSCEQSDLYLQAGLGDSRGIACYVSETSSGSGSGGSGEAGSGGPAPTTAIHR